MHKGLRCLLASASRAATAQRALRCSHFSSVAKRPENPRVFENPADFKPYVLGLRYTEFTNKLELIEDSPVIPIFQVMDVDGNLIGDWKNPFPSNDDVLEHYKTMVRLSIWDNLFYNIQRQGRISFYIQNQGEEAMQIGCGLALKHEDHVFGQYRELGVLYCKGFTEVDALNQLFANKGDEGKGRQMPISYSKKECNIHAICTPLTSQLPHAAGAGYALKLQKAAACAVGFFGEGAASEGDFHAAMNMAAVRQSQTIFACRNNGYAISTPVCDQYYGDGIAIRGVAYGMPTIRVDGNDFFASYIATKHAREHCVTRSTPICIEYMTYRLGHHSTSDESSQYRGPGEFEVWTAGGNNGINRVRKYLELNGLWDEERDEALRKEARSYMLKKIREVEVVKHVDLSSGIFDDVYDKPHPLLEEQREKFIEHVARYGDKYNVERYETR
ncbi:dehydrogenase E1 component family protein [Babesia ovata]|uniref:2-oxoisovalerate dehydrogenase subunit alpha n=1 Tax=Babesia ovata TaxID=189622 RepID=A0A2H6K6V8_9APIC|nr:dehydrogenase E1 component family protein [Babesia ovata]GBE58733.1 dehydrogenase E1 component family protein [Babesia ovata]